MSARPVLRHDPAGDLARRAIELADDAAERAATEARTEPVPSACEGWYLADDVDGRSGFTSDPAQAVRRPRVAPLDTPV